jgi:hypothetical protein
MVAFMGVAQVQLSSVRTGDPGTTVAPEEAIDRSETAALFAGGDE